MQKKCLVARIDKMSRHWLFKAIAILICGGFLTAAYDNTIDGKVARQMVEKQAPIVENLKNRSEKDSIRNEFFRQGVNGKLEFLLQRTDDTYKLVLELTNKKRE